MEPGIYEAMLRDQQHHWWFVARRKILSSVLSSLPLKAESRICEAGCGVGGNLAMLATFGQVHAFEINPSAMEKCRLMSDADIREGSLPDHVPFPSDQKFDLVVAFDVLEHIEDDHNSFAALVNMLDKDAYLFITVPAYAWMMSAHDHAHHHFRRYSRSSLKALANREDVEVLRVGYFNTLLFPAIAARRLIGKSDKKSHSDADMPSSITNGILRRIFSLEAWFTGHFFFPFGTSLGLLVRKKS